MQPTRFLRASFALLCLAPLAGAQTVQFGVCLEGSQEVPPVTTSGTGFATVTLDTATGAVTVSGSYTNLSGDQTVAHIHGPAAIGQNAGIVLALAGTGGTSGALSGSGTLSAAEVQDMLNGLHYINVHSQAHPPGELRGQIVQELNQDCPAAQASDPVLADNAGNVSIGPKIDSTTDPFNVSLDCSGAGASGIYVIELRAQKSAVPSATPFGSIWCSGPLLFRCSGMHAQNVVTCFPGSGQVLPNDVGLVGRTFCVQGFCGDPSAQGRTSNALVQTIGL